MAKASVKRKKAKAEIRTAGGQLAVNRRARFLYTIEETVEAGLALVGTEVKAARAGGANLTDSYVRLKRSEAFLVGCHIGAYTAAGPAANHDPVRERKLLLHRRELDRLGGKVRERGYALLVTRLYLSRGRIKAEVALARGKKTHDKRAAIKERVVKKEMERAIKQYR